MADTITTITTFINSPPAQLLAGGVLAGIVWKFFERVESVLTDDTKLAIAVWLLDVKTSDKIQSWPDTFTVVFDRVFGQTHPTWKGFWRSSVASVAAVIVMLAFSPNGVSVLSHKWFNPADYFFLPLFVANIIVGNAFFDYCSLVETRIVISLMGKSVSASKQLALLLADLSMTVGFAFMTLLVGSAFQWSVVFLMESSTRTGLAKEFPFFLRELTHLPEYVLPTVRVKLNYGAPLLWFYPAFLTSMWLWLYAGSGFLLKAARHFDIGFQWFNRHFDIGKKPLQSIGLVAGALVAVLYWTAMIAGRFI